jgi:hypothetical protein
MASQSGKQKGKEKKNRKHKQQKETVERVMHEFKHGELESGSGKTVRNPKQASAIALHEAGASRYESDEKNEENLKRTKERERRGETAKAAGGDAGTGDAGTGDDEAGGGNEESAGRTRAELYAQAKDRDIPGRSKMNKEDLAHAVEEDDRQGG